MKLKQSPFAVLIAGLASSSVCAQAKWNIPASCPDGNFHTRNVKQFAEVLLNK